MSEWSDFPLLPDDRRYLVRMDQGHARDPPEMTTSSGPFEEWPSTASQAADESLLRYLIWPTTLERWKRRKRIPSPRNSRKVRARIPKRYVPGMSLLVAAALLPFGIIFCFLCRPDLHGRRLRARQITPNDMRRLFSEQGLTPEFLIRRFRV